MQDGELKEIGESFNGTNMRPYNFPIEGNFDKLYLRHELVFFFYSKLVVDFRYNCVWKFPKFKKHIKDLMDEEWELQKQMVIQRNDLIDKNEFNDNYDVFFDSRREDSLARIEQGKKILNRLTLNIDTEKKIPIEEIKKIPFTTFLEFNSGGFCRCPFHLEKTPSMKYYEDKNKVHCFGCNKSYDIIDYIMLRENLDFIGSVKFLSKWQGTYNN